MPIHGSRTGSTSINAACARLDGRAQRRVHHEHIRSPRGGRLFKNVAVRAARQGQGGACARCEARQTLGLSGRRSCRLRAQELSYGWASAAKWL